MALAQAKLSKSEWNAIEIPVNENDKYVLSFLISASKNKDLTLCSKLTLSQYTKLSINEEVHYHLYTTFIQPKLEKHLDLLGISSCLTKRPNKRTTISKADVIRLNNTTKHLTTDTTRRIYLIRCSLHTVSKFIKQSRAIICFAWACNYFIISDSYFESISQECNSRITEKV